MLINRKNYFLEIFSIKKRNYLGSFFELISFVISLNAISAAVKR